MATCPKCLRDVPKLTRDHIFPRWLWCKLPLLGARQPAAWLEMICGPCNTEKGGRIAWHDARTREILRHLAVRLIEQCYEAEKDIRDGLTIEREKQTKRPKARKAYRVAPSGKLYKEPEGTSLAEALRQLEAPEGGHDVRVPRVRIEDPAPPDVVREIDRHQAKKKSGSAATPFRAWGVCPKGMPFDTHGFRHYLCQTRQVAREEARCAGGELRVVEIECRALPPRRRS